MPDETVTGNLTVTNNVGIGTDNPNARLHILSANAAPSRAFLESSGALLKLVVDANGAVIGTDNAFPLSLQTDGSSQLTINNAGDIGIGTSTPSTKLEVVGNLKATAFQGNGATLDGIVKKAGDTIAGALNLQNILTVSGNVGIGTVANPANLTVNGAVNATGATTLANTLTVSGNVTVGTIPTPANATVNGTVTATKFVGEGSGLTKIPVGQLNGQIQASQIGTIPASQITGIVSSQWLTGSGGNLSYSGGNVGISTTNPSRAKLEVAGRVGATVGLFGTDAQGISLVASWPSVGFNSYFNNGWKSIAAGWTGNIHVNQDAGGITLQIGQRSTAANEAITLANHFSVSANGAVSIPGKLIFGAQTRQMINLWSEQYGIGVQSGTQYFRTADSFAWFVRGVHHDNTYNPGAGGARLMVLNSAGDLILSARTNPEGSSAKSLCRALVDGGNMLGINWDNDYVNGVVITNLRQGSSRELKKNITELSKEESLQALDQLRCVKFNYTVESDAEKDTDLHVGFIAEEIPDLLASADRKSVGPLDVVAVLTKVVQAQQQMIQALSEKVSALESQMQPS